MNIIKRNLKTVVLLTLVLLLLLGIGVAAIGRTGEAGALVSIGGDSSHGAGEPFRILVAGKDRASGLCDVLMLCCINPSTGQADLLQLPRDTFAAYNDGSYCKLNGAMQALGGMEGLCSFLEDAFALSVDRYVCMDLDALRVATDAVGGVEITLTQPMTYRDPYQDLEIRLPAGTQVLDGQAAESFVRFRSDYVRGDLGRLDAQKIFLSAFFRKVRATTNLPTLLRLVAMALQYTETNLSMSELMQLGKFALRAEPARLTFFTLPGEPCTVKETGASYFVLSRPAVAELLAARFGCGKESFDPAEVFCHHRNTEFCRIYQTYCAYEGIQMNEILEKGLQIQRNP